jgi:hypothetical protein
MPFIPPALVSFLLHLFLEAIYSQQLGIQAFPFPCGRLFYA